MNFMIKLHTSVDGEQQCTGSCLDITHTVMKLYSFGTLDVYNP